MTMLTGNLATRPFYNERLLRVALVGAVAAAVAWAAVNAATLVSLSQQSTMLNERVRTEGVRASAARAEAEALRGRLNVAEVNTTARAATEANHLIEQRTFSWTALFNQLEATLPADVRLVEVQPQLATDGRFMVALTVVSRRVEDLDAFIERLEATGSFSGVLSRADTALEDGTIESSLQGYYREPAAKPPVTASEPKTSPELPRGAEVNR